MKKLKYIVLAMISSTLLLQSCSEDKLDDINKNQNDPETIEAKYLLTDVMTATSFSITGSDLAFYSSIYSELLAGIDNQMYRAQTRDGDPQLASTYDNKWGDIYSQLKSLKEVIAKCSEGGSEAGNYNALAVGEILTAYNLGILTNLWGDVPYSEALQPGVIFQPKLDKQEDIYKEIFRLLDDAIENANKTSKFASLANNDILYKGDMKLWEKAAYALKARYTMQLSAIKPDYAKVIEYVDLAFTSTGEDLKANTTSIPYPFWLFQIQRTGLGSSKSFYDLMNKNNETDPRIKDYFKEITLNGVTGIYLVDNSQARPTEGRTLYSPSGLAFSDAEDRNKSNAIYMFSYHELLFLKAEAQARLGQDTEARETLVAAISAAMNKTQQYKYPTYQPNVGTITGNDLLARIEREKYIAQFEIESIQAYNDVRRWRAMGESYIQLVNPNRFPERFSYGQSDVANNANVKAAFGNGEYVYTEKVWWAHGTR